MHRFIPEEGNLVRVKASGKLTQEDYDQLIPSWKKTIAKFGSMRLLLVLQDFERWEPGAAWDDFRFGTSHSEKVERIAVVGEKAWQKWLMKLGVFPPGRFEIFRVIGTGRSRGAGFAPNEYRSEPAHFGKYRSYQPDQAVAFGIVIKSS